MRRLSVILVLIVLAMLPADVRAGQFSSLVVFGDSLSDAGRAFDLSGGAFPPSPPYAGRFSNGPVAAEYLAGFLGLPLAHSGVPGGTDFAVGGATTGEKNVSFETDFPPGVGSIIPLSTTGILNQVGEFLSGGPAVDRSTALFMVWGGPNDIVLGQALGEDPFDTVANAIGNLVGTVEALALAGATHFLVPNMVDLGQTPEFRGTPLEGPLRFLIEAFNAGLADSLALLAGGLGLLGLPVEITVFDTFGAFDEVLTHPAAGGFTNITDQCVENLAVLLSGCPGYLFFDFTHPTTATHRILGSLFFSAVPAPSSALLLLAGVVGVAGWLRRRRGGSRP
jgi:phospholipase/lecithinase/hemolysin